MQNVSLEEKQFVCLLISTTDQSFKRRAQIFWLIQQAKFGLFKPAEARHRNDASSARSRAIDFAGRSQMSPTVVVVVVAVVVVLEGDNLLNASLFYLQR